MTRSSRFALLGGVIVLVAVVALLLVALLPGRDQSTPASDTSALTTDYAGLPRDAVTYAKPLQEVVDSQGPADIASTSNGQLAVVVWGSGSCVVTVTSVTVVGPQHVALATAPDLPTAEPSGVADGCTADLGPHTSVLDLPAGVTLEAPLTVDVDANRFTLPPTR